MQIRSAFSIALAAFAVAAHANTIVCQLEVKASAKAVAHDFGVVLVDQTFGAPFALYRTRPGQNEDVIQAKMRLDPRVMWSEDNIEVVSPEGSGAGKGSTIAAVGDRNDLYALNDAWLQQIHFSPTLAQTPGRTVRVAILDTGLSPLQMALWTKTVASMNAVEPRLRPYDVPMSRDTNGNTDPDEAVGHGTMIAGIVDQIAPLTDLVIVRVADSDGVSTAWRLIKGIAFAVTNNAEVANISLGSLSEIPALSDVMSWAQHRGLVLVAPAGNNSIEDIMSPASISEVIGVAGVNEFDLKAPFSNWHHSVRQSAPSTGIKSFWWDGTLGVWSGTSFASPMVAAGIADVLRRRPPMNPDDLIGIVRRSGDNINALNPSFADSLGLRLNLQDLDNDMRH
ncbi:MAG: S8 family serine peptidase [Fimbriimonadaceae bacterium]|nr:S8 family serine peptidase [Fimbriimonadaceae bacterium]